MSENLKTAEESRILNAVASGLEQQIASAKASDELMAQLAPKLVDIFGKLVDKACEAIDKSEVRQAELHAEMKAERKSQRSGH
jgi:polyribonucleotide nucleotidyltransferase